MAKKKKCPPAGAPEWLVTFADLMSLLVCFFVLIISFSIQDKEKLQIVAGSMRDAFGIKVESRHQGMIEIEGVPVREYVRRVAPMPTETDSEIESTRHDGRTKQGPENNTYDVEITDVERTRQFATAAASLRQAWQDMPDIAELSKNIIIEENDEGLNIMLVDQDGRSMFPEGSKFPYESTRQLLERMAEVVRAMPNRIRVTGHTTSGRTFNNPNYSGWDLSADRANATRRILNQFGVRSDQIFSVVGKADTEPLFPNDPFLAANRRISILLMKEEPPLPPDYKP
ncbi:chemotaxis protein MotB [Rhodobium orientis]|uniref:OmpA-like domain-containing protein n=1 Tax=Rhodobium orientis TaxID=34017 RepID=A0A327JK64_9HYPH|nr:flagellar motor protein MotB [Rhodobium orientis]MBB4302896.1 chemotaxis protein MotB [Rhodobium orientis]MBK5949457.1 hypothetical protein [Rhodobium orientis]RAI26026.1 hypothetical protein CH339_15855 [Rhodobium orientis]